MKTLILFLLLAVTTAVSAQSPAFDSVLTTAHAGHKAVLLRFSGSDWCIPCIRMEKEIFGDSAFSHYAAVNLLTVQADFPRQKKHQLSRIQQQANEKLAERYNPQGEFPLLVLLDGNGKVLRRWEGAVTDKAAFIAELDRHRREL
ncbi:thioredoxin family protein [Flaviaesturariibacter flavus]|uniref:Thioredoxin family protein n=1 Tax=Flaviaesturariibacter flavus TaxID=2502780 RepID=A0A4R1BQ44_9BACT|nr:thioredoxin family protein [Flaviaesturariibacter flavus]TCJ19345.1 thioredoxin family protein [Flaviaesturariibacter flavus]